MLVPFNTLMQRPDVVALAGRTFAAEGVPDWLARFMALTMACSPCNPEDDMLESYVRDGVCVFYARALGPGGEPELGYEPWTCTLMLGGSLSFFFGKADHVAAEDNYTVDDSWETEPGHPPTKESLGWPDSLHALLDRSHWLVVRQPADLQL